MIRNILICTTQVPFTSGGAESHVEGLRRALIAAGYAAEVVALPFKWYPPTEIMRGAMAWRMLDLSTANGKPVDLRSEEHTSELQSHSDLVCRLLLLHTSTPFPYTTLFRSRFHSPAAARNRTLKVCDAR